MSCMVPWERKNLNQTGSLSCVLYLTSVSILIALTLDCWVQPTLVYWMVRSGIGMGMASVSSPSTCCGLRLWWLHPLSDCCWWPLSGWEFMLPCFPSEKDTWTPVSNCLHSCVCAYSYTVLHVCVNTWSWKLISGSLSENSSFRFSS